MIGPFVQSGFGLDWGGLIGLRLVAREPERFARIAVANSGLPDGNRPPSDAFLLWQEFARSSPSLPTGSLVDLGSASQLPSEVVAAYDAPFPTDEFMAGARAWPLLVPTTPDDPEAAANAEAWGVLERFDRPFVCWFSDSDRITAGGEHAFIGRVAGAAGQQHEPVRGAGHFLQEDAGGELARRLINFMADSSSDRGV